MIERKTSTRTARQSTRTKREPKSFVLEVNKAEELEEVERTESHRINKKTFIIIMLIFLFLNLSLSLFILEKVNKIWDFTVQQNWGKEKLEVLEKLYENPNYQSYIEEEISNLINRIDNITNI